MNVEQITLLISVNFMKHSIICNFMNKFKRKSYIDGHRKSGKREILMAKMCNVGMYMPWS